VRRSCDAENLKLLPNVATLVARNVRSWWHLWWGLAESVFGGGFGILKSCVGFMVVLVAGILLQMPRRCFHMSYIL
jgi:hypothetical protein